jgi:PKHD-type hydroxylase
MSNYHFLPSPTFGVSEHSFTTWREAFTNEELDKIVEIGNTLEQRKAVVSGNSVEDDISKIRESQVSWIKMNEETVWIYDRLAYVARCLNGEFYKFDLYGFSEDLQFTTYDSEKIGHYTWHQDSGGSRSSPPRKFSLVMQLTDPNDYEGGDLEVFTTSEPTKVNKERGMITAFPSYTLHRVTPITKGIRKSLVVWATGPAFV